MELSKLIEEKKKLEKDILQLIQTFQQKTDGFYRIFNIDFDEDRRMDGSQLINKIKIKGLI